MYVSVCVHGSPEEVSSSASLVFVAVRQGVSLNWSSSFSLGWLVNTFLGSPSLCPCAGVTDVLSCPWLFLWVLAILPWVFMLAISGSQLLEFKKYVSCGTY